MIRRAEILRYVKEQYGIAPDFPWDSTSHAVLRHKTNNKWFGAILKVTESQLGLDSDRVVDIINLKCDHIMIGALRKEPGIFPAWHMNKAHWISVLLSSNVPKEKVFALIDMSYDLTKAKSKRLM